MASGPVACRYRLTLLTYRCPWAQGMAPMPTLTVQGGPAVLLLGLVGDREAGTEGLVLGLVLGLGLGLGEGLLLGLGLGLGLWLGLVNGSGTGLVGLDGLEGEVEAGGLCGATPCSAGAGGEGGAGVPGADSVSTGLGGLKFGGVESGLGGL